MPNLTPTQIKTAKAADTLEDGFNQLANIGSEGASFHMMVVELYNLAKNSESEDATFYRDIADSIQTTAEKMNSLLNALQSSVIVPLRARAEDVDQNADLRSFPLLIADYLSEIETVWRKVEYGRQITGPGKPAPQIMNAELGKKIAQRRASLTQEGGAEPAGLDKPRQARKSSSESGFPKVQLRSTKAAAVNACTVCDCTNFSKSQFKVGQCNNCFHAHAE